MLFAVDRVDVVDEDFVDLIFALEASFWIELTENDLVDPITVGDLFDCVMRKCAPLGSPECLSRVAFYRLKRSLIGLSGEKRKTIRPSTPLTTLLPWRSRDKHWQSIETELRVIMPALGIDERGMFTLIAIAAVSGIWVGAVYPRPDLWGWVIAFAVGLLSTHISLAILLLITRPLHRNFPVDVQTVGDLARLIVIFNHQKMAIEAGGTTERQAWSAFQELVGRTAGKSALSIRREMRLTLDLFG